MSVAQRLARLRSALRTGGRSKRPEPRQMARRPLARRLRTPRCRCRNRWRCGEAKVFIDYDKTLRQIEAELARLGIALGIDWADESRVRALAREVMDHWHNGGRTARLDRQQIPRRTLYGLVGLLVLTMPCAPGAAGEPDPVRQSLARAFESIQGPG
jgi:hypothetical protein